MNATLSTCHRGQMAVHGPGTRVSRLVRCCMDAISLCCCSGMHRSGHFRLYISRPKWHLQLRTTGPGAPTSALQQQTGLALFTSRERARPHAAGTDRCMRGVTVDQLMCCMARGAGRHEIIYGHQHVLLLMHNSGWFAYDAGAFGAASCNHVSHTLHPCDAMLCTAACCLLAATAAAGAQAPASRAAELSAAAAA